MPIPERDGRRQSADERPDPPPAPIRCVQELLVVRDSDERPQEDFAAGYGALRQGAAGSRSDDHAEAVTPRLYSGCTARQGRDNRTLHNARQFLLRLALALLHTNTRGELGHQVANIVLTTPGTLPFCSMGITQWARSCGEASALVCPNKTAIPQNVTERVCILLYIREFIFMRFNRFHGYNTYSHIGRHEKMTESL